MSSTFKKAGIPLIILVLTLAVLAILISLKPKPEKKDVVEKDFLVEVMPIALNDVDFLVKSQGSVSPKNQTVLISQVSGRVVSLSDQFVDGGFFKQGDLLAELEKDDYLTEVKLAEAELARAQAALDEEVARGRVAAQEWRSVNSGKAPELGLRKPQLVREQANVKAAEANLERTKRNLSRTSIRAPYDGLVKKREVDLGQFISTGSRIGEVYSTDVAEIRLPLTDSDMSYVRKEVDSAQSTVVLSARVAGKDKRWFGKLVRNEAVLDQSSRVVYAVVEVPDPYLLNGASKTEPLMFGRFVSAQITGIKAKNIATLPRHVLRLDGTILVVDSEKKMRIVPVEVQRADEKYVYINDGLNNGDLVVVSAVSNPYDGMPVRFPDDNTGLATTQKDGRAVSSSSVAKGNE